MESRRPMLFVEEKPALPPGMMAAGGEEVALLKEQVKEGNLTGLRAYLLRSRAQSDWQDRVFVLERVAALIRIEALDFACDVEPSAPELLVARTAYFALMAKTMRGTGTSDKVTDERFQSAAACVQTALQNLNKAVELDPADPTACACVLPALTIFAELVATQRAVFQRAISIAPDLVAAGHPMVTRLSERWGGSAEMSLKLAREAMTKAGPGSDMPVCLFWAHLLAQNHLQVFDRKPDAAKEYLQRSDVQQELNAAFDPWVDSIGTPRRSSIPYLHFAACWYSVVEDQPRLQRALSLIGNVFNEVPWNIYGDPLRQFERAQHLAAGNPLPPEIKPDARLLCFSALARAIDTARAGKLEEAQASIAIAVRSVKGLSPDDAKQMTPLVLLAWSMVGDKVGQKDKAAQFREQAWKLLDSGDGRMEHGRFQQLMGHVLNYLGEYRRALPYYQRALQLEDAELTPTVQALILSELGLCYQRVGLPDHAAIPLRAALEIYRAMPGDPRLGSALLHLGNALRKSSPAEAERLYKECAELHLYRMQAVSATTAWVNLAILCSETGRHAESLELYQRVLRIREQTQGTPAASLGSALNNIANCYRRMKRFDEAHAAVDRAIPLASADDKLLTAAYGTRGLIFLDAGDDVQAVQWLRKSAEQRRQQPSPNMNDDAENLEHEIAALKRLDRGDEASAAQRRLAALRESLQAIAPVDGELRPAAAQIDGAVFLELPIGKYSMLPDERKDITALSRALAEQVREQNAGYYGGQVTIAESTTLIFYGRDAEAVFAAIQPVLSEHDLCAGASVLIRQGATQRELVLPHRVQMLN